jgi:hypothetical protein
MQTNLMHKNMSTYIEREQYNTNMGPHKLFL